MVKLYKQDAKSKAEEVFIPYKKLCKSLEVSLIDSVMVRYLVYKEINFVLFI